MENEKATLLAELLEVDPEEHNLTAAAQKLAGRNKVKLQQYLAAIRSHLSKQLRDHCEALATATWGKAHVERKLRELDVVVNNERQPKHIEVELH